MLKIKHLETGEIYTVYGLSGTKFLVWQCGIGWWYMPMECVEPVEVE